MDEVKKNESKSVFNSHMSLVQKAQGLAKKQKD